MTDLCSGGRSVHVMEGQIKEPIQSQSNLFIHNTQRLRERAPSGDFNAATNQQAKAAVTCRPQRFVIVRTFLFNVRHHQGRH